MEKRKEMWIKLRYDDRLDMFKLWSFYGTEKEAEDAEDNGDWSLIVACECRNGENSEPEMIHYSILTEMRDMLKNGAKYYGASRHWGE